MSSVLLRSTLALGLSALAAPAFATDFAACFTLTPGVSWSTADETLTIEKAPFNGAPALKVSSAGGGIGRASFFDASGRMLLGEERYGISAWGGDASAPVMTDAFDPAPTFPQRATPGEQFQLNGKGTRTHHVEETVTDVDYDGFNHYTFVGFENVEATVDGNPRTFADTCHLRATFEDNRMEAWYAPGFGRIKFERYMGEELLMRDEIEAIHAD
ncbi:hypothetical protein J7J08_12200 [Stenotrophomonas sp. ISL-67]|uniref:hypothetical protein n=1 Tax=Stenotrophomonas sp. ISL-67 TaxID=2819171 RepID=UPI001BEC34DC|nr:hypothetical protein [Stenotrophomonas sp. ISL-67]MBT2768400.1 hypothetical protein [Stenotrophomonas sp. ISL-67]